MRGLVGDHAQNVVVESERKSIPDRADHHVPVQVHCIELNVRQRVHEVRGRLDPQRPRRGHAPLVHQHRMLRAGRVGRRFCAANGQGRHSSREPPRVPPSHRACPEPLKSPRSGRFMLWTRCPKHLHACGMETAEKSETHAGKWRPAAPHSLHSATGPICPGRARHNSKACTFLLSAHYSTEHDAVPRRGGQDVGPVPLALCAGQRVGTLLSGL